MSATKQIKAAIGWLCCHLGLFSKLVGNNGVILLFHRVNPNIDGYTLNCSPDDFEQYCKFLKRYFRVVPLSEMVDKLAKGQDLSGLAAINFDDGYADNYEFAAPILQKHKLPACFFVATNFIGSEHWAPWDKDQGVKSGWMSWDQVRDLRARGFEVGAHTLNHIDLGIVKGAEAQAEIVGSRNRLESELGEKIPLFSYPFGGKKNIVKENIALIKDAQFICCPSAYGGLVAPGSDPFKMQRQPITPDWCTSPWQLAFELIQESHAKNAHRPDNLWH